MKENMNFINNYGFVQFIDTSFILFFKTESNKLEAHN